MLTSRILRFKQFGLVYRWRKTYIPRPEKDCAMYVSLDGVRIESLMVAFGILGGGVLTGVVVLILEKSTAVRNYEQNFYDSRMIR